jgi:hypothetical protein
MREILTALAADGALWRLARLFGKRAPDGGGLCHDLAIALMRDLMDVNAADGWTWVEGVVMGTSAPGLPIVHSWNEFGEWEFDASSGMGVIAESSIYRRAKCARVTNARDAPATLRIVRAPSTKVLFPGVTP